MPLLGALCACLLFIAGCAPPAPRATAPAPPATTTPVPGSLPASPTATEAGPGNLPAAVTRAPAAPTSTSTPDATPAQPTALATSPAALATPTAAPSPAVEIANPAAAYCQQQGYTSEILTAADGSQYGACVAPGGKECDEWAFFHHKCALPAPAAGAQASPGGPSATPGTPPAGASLLQAAAPAMPAQGSAPVTPTLGASPVAPASGASSVTPTLEVFPATPAPELAPALAAQLDALFAPWDRQDSPGCALGLGQAGALEYARGYGMADLEHGVPITSGTIFNVGSLSKQFTGLAVASLLQAGEISLDDDVRKYVPELPDYGTTITIRELLAHTSGLRDDRTLALMAGWRDDDFLTAGDLLGLIYRQQGLNYPPGQAYLYSNSDYSLLPLVVERVSGQPLAQYAAARIFGPLGMAGTHFEEDPYVVVPGRADAYEPYSDTYRLSLPDVAMPGPTGLDTNVGDLMLWADNFSTGRAGGPAAIQEMMAPASLADGSPVYYNFGLMQRTYADLGYTIGHDGYEGGFKSYLLILPARRQAVAVLCNLETIDPAPLAEQAARLFAGHSPFATPAPSPTPAVSAEAAITLPGSTLAARAGAYFDPTTTGFVRFYVDGNELRVEGEPAIALAPVAAGRFQVLAHGTATAGIVEFAPAAEGRFTAEVTDAGALSGSYQPYPQLSAAGLGCAGTFYSADLGATYSITVERGILTLNSRRFVGVPLLPVGPRQFVMANAQPAIRVDFASPESGDVATGFTLSLDRARNVRFVRAAAGSAQEALPGTAGP